LNEQIKLDATLKSSPADKEANIAKLVFNDTLETLQIACLDLVCGGMFFA
jgi:hypothetical protein